MEGDKITAEENAEIKGIEQIVGLFINTLPLRIKYKKGDTVGKLLKAVDDALKERKEREREEAERKRQEDIQRQREENERIRKELEAEERQAEIGTGRVEFRFTGAVRVISKIPPEIVQVDIGINIKEVHS